MIERSQSEARKDFIDFSPKFSLVKANETRCKRIFELLCDISKETVKNKSKGLGKRGLLLSYGKFDKNNNIVYGMVQLNKKQTNDNVMWIQDKKFKDFLIEKSETSDGAIIINHDGLVLGTDINLTVDNPIASIEDECATRHLTAMSFSEREDVISTFTLSEETSKVRVYIHGKREELFDPYNSPSQKSLVQ